MNIRKLKKRIFIHKDSLNKNLYIGDSVEFLNLHNTYGNIRKGTIFWNKIDGAWVVCGNEEFPLRELLGLEYNGLKITGTHPTEGFLLTESKIYKTFINKI